MTKEQFAQQTEGTVEQRDFQVRQVSNGFALTGNRRFNDPDTNVTRLAQTIEAVATDAQGVVAAVSNFVSTGSF